MKKINIIRFALVSISVMLWSSNAQSQSTTQLLSDSNKKVEILNNITDNSTLVTEYATTTMRDPVMIMIDTSKMKHTPMKKMNMPADTSTVYTCPMHPEVTASKPGKCPKCGMDLVKKPVKKKIEKGDMKMI
jgi:hypothetical protein